MYHMTKKKLLDWVLAVLIKKISSLSHREVPFVPCTRFWIGTFGKLSAEVPPPLHIFCEISQRGNFEILYLSKILYKRNFFRFRMNYLVSYHMKLLFRSF